MTLDVKLEGVLFYKAAPIKKTTLCKLLEVAAEELEGCFPALQERLASGATRLVISDTEVELVTAPDLDEMIEGMRKDEMKRDIGKAGAETLAIVLYKGPIARAEIDRIRGVNSSYILRNLLVRGLIERNTSGKQLVFTPTTALLAHLGVTERTQMEDFSNVMNALEHFENQQENV